MMTTRTTLLASLVLLIAPAIACDATIADDSNESSAGTNDDGGDGDGGADGGSFDPCTSDNPCPDGQFCFNGLCAVGCQSDANCADNQYCSTDLMLCQNSEVPTCTADGDCAESQLCVNGYCTTPPANTGCNTEDYLNDGCDSNAVCLEDVDTEQGSCYTMPACAEDGSCPTGLEGGVCNEGYLPTKDEICLVGLCDDVSHCPADWNCVRLIENSALGNCSSGQIGSACASGEDCISGNCTALPGLSGGFCG